MKYGHYDEGTVRPWSKKKLCAVILLASLSGTCVYFIASIQFHLIHLREVTDHLITELTKMYPLCQFHATVSYESNVIYLFANEGNRKLNRQQLADWLRNEFMRRSPATEVVITFNGESEEKRIMVKRE